MHVSFEDCVADLVTIPDNRNLLAWWERRPQTRPTPEDRALQIEFIRQIKGFTHQALFEIPPEAVKDAMHHTEHSLGALDKHTHSLQLVEDFDTPFAQSFFFHHCLESQRQVPLWQNIWAAKFDEPYRSWYFERLQIHARDRFTEGQVVSAFQWRFGKYYYSALRELYIFSALRHVYGVPLKCHLFADLVLKVDGWHGWNLMYLRVPNQWEMRKKGPKDGGGVFNVVPVAVQ